MTKKVPRGDHAPIWAGLKTVIVVSSEVAGMEVRRVGVPMVGRAFSDLRFFFGLLFHIVLRH